MNITYCLLDCMMPFYMAYLYIKEYLIFLQRKDLRKRKLEYDIGSNFDYFKVTAENEEIADLVAWVYLICPIPNKDDWMNILNRFYVRRLFNFDGYIPHHTIQYYKDPLPLTSVAIENTKDNTVVLKNEEKSVSLEIRNNTFYPHKIAEIFI